MKKIIAILVIMTSMVGFCGGHNYHKNHHSHHNYHNHHNQLHHIHNCHNTPIHFVSSVIGGVVGGMIAQRNRVWIPQQTIIVGYDIFNRPIFKIIPAHYEYR